MVKGIRRGIAPSTSSRAIFCWTTFFNGSVTPSSSAIRPANGPAARIDPHDLAADPPPSGVAKPLQHDLAELLLADRPAAPDVDHAPHLVIQPGKHPAD
jgi:hypothetical protein